MPPEKSEVQKFFDELPSESKQGADIFKVEEPAKPAVEAEAEGEPAKAPEPRKNRHHRRLEARVEVAERRAIEAEARERARAEFEATARTESVDERLLRLYGPENLEAAKLHMDLLNDYSDRGYQKAVEEIETRNQKRISEEREFETYIDNELETLEDEYSVDLTSDAPAARKTRRELLELVQKLSPKDEQGELTAYADFGETFELYRSTQARPTPTTERAKEIAARSMETGGTGEAPAKQPTPGFRGWMRDMNLGQQ